jgi:hypothetical protein
MVIILTYCTIYIGSMVSLEILIDDYYYDKGYTYKYVKNEWIIKARSPINFYWLIKFKKLIK